MSWRRAVVIGASGGIGNALAGILENGGSEVLPFSRSSRDAQRIDIEDEASIAAAAARVAEGGPPDLVFVATGALTIGGSPPEKTWRSLDADLLARSYAINAIGPALVAKHFLPVLPRQGRCAFAALGARVGSIGDNRLGGWYGYRASKAALAMLVRTLAIELARSRPEAVCVALHPGTVDTGLSRPFQGNVAEGSLFTPRQSAERMLRVLEGLSPADSGGHFAWDGSRIAP
ncbi:SDR family oxidoreductase [Tsuneonella deserti]|uniref:SDR family oxidoreductase n=1 Tax=Tsuneonella deserti TaxID=2035528 RepID=A0ABQ1S780_9SPHN|nr:SDR family NAD(P)-dependent oxidoreductase [Tsuneonella deserti]GGD92205.1 SDR family oxidoreductase [Tsuneonella deserti]